MQKLADTIDRGEVHPLYYLYGDETFLIDDTVQALTKTVLKVDDLRDFNLNIFYGEEADAEQIRDAVETLPVMCPARVVIVKDAHAFSDKDWDALSPLVDNPVSSAVFICVASKIDRRKKHIKRFAESGVVVEFKRPYDNQIPDWIRTLARKHEVKMGADEVELFHQLVGSNLQDINAELSKLVLYLGSQPGDRSSVTADDILHVVSRVRHDSVFDLTEAIGRGDRLRALDCLVNLLDHGQNEVGVLALISRHVRILKLVSDGLREGLQGARLSSRAGVSPYFLRSYVDQSRTWSEMKIESTFRALLDTDRALKSSPVASHIWLENFIIRTCP